MQEQFPDQQQPSLEAQKQLSTEERVQNATPEELGAVFDAQEQALKQREEAGTGSSSDRDGFAAAQGLFDVWKNKQPEERGSFLDGVHELGLRLAKNEGLAQTVGKANAERTITAASWLGTSGFKKQLRGMFEAQGVGAEQHGRAEEAYHMPTEAERQAQATRDEQEAQRRHTAEAAENARKVVIVNEARESLESVREQSELTDTIVNFGKDNTYVLANHGRGGINYGTMDRDEEKKLHELTRKSRVDHAFGADDYGNVRKPEGVNWQEAGTGERASFVPVVEQEFRTETRTEVVEKKRFGKDVTREVPFQVAVPGSERQKTVVNPETGQQEPAVLFQYDFEPTVLGHEATNAIDYREFIGNRTGPKLSVALELPRSVADKLLANIEKRPEYVREVAEALVLNNTAGTISEEDWRKGGPASNNPVRPPYERVRELAPNWKIAIAKPKPGADIATFVNGRKGEGFEVTKLKAA